MSRILALDTSTEACSCALLDSSTGVQEDFAVIPRQHAARLLPMIRGLLAANDCQGPELQAIAFGRGPGSFTGLRIAAGISQGLALAWQLPVIPVSTLAALAWETAGKSSPAAVFASLDARIEELYWGCYLVQNGTIALLGDEQLCSPESIPAELPAPAPARQWIAAGSGLHYLERMPLSLPEQFSRLAPAALPRASAIAELALLEWQAGNTISAAEIQPVYLRDKVTQQPA